MKRFILIFILSLPLLCNSQIRFSQNYYAEGFWGDWKESYDAISSTRGGFVIHSPYSHPSKWIVKVLFSPDLDIKRSKYRFKNKIPQEVPCTVIFRHDDSVKDIGTLMTLIYRIGNKESSFDGTIEVYPHKPKKKTANLKTFIVKVGNYAFAIDLKGAIVYNIKQ